MNIYLQLRGVVYVCIDDHTFFNIWNTVLANPILLLISTRPLQRGYRRYHPGKQNCQSVAVAVQLCNVYLNYYHDRDRPTGFQFCDTLIHTPKFLVLVNYSFTKRNAVLD